MSSLKAAVIGSGFSGLSAATHLASKGFKVDMFEKNSTPGGRARQFDHGGFSFDMGPSWYWMPDVFEAYFAGFGKTVEEYYKLVRLDPSYTVRFSDGESWDLPAGSDGISELFESIEPGSAIQLKKFLGQAQTKYRIAMTDMVYKPGLSVKEFMNVKVLTNAMRMQMFRSMSNHVRTYFRDPRLVQLLEFPVLFLGAKPSRTPAMYSLMNYADMVLGTWYPMGGMYKIVEAMVSLAEEKGVKIHYDAPVSRIVSDGKRAQGVIVNGNFFEADVVVSAADYHHTESILLEERFRNYSDAYWKSREMAPSALIYYIGLDRKLPGARHHNLFFDADFDRHISMIYDRPGWPDDPLFYVSATSVTDPSVAPEGCENLFVLIPTAPGMEESDAIKDKYFHHVITRMEKAWGENIRDHVIYRRDFAGENFQNEYNSFKGNAYGLSNTLRQTAILKPSVRNKHLSNLFYAGQLTVPGPGVPPALISGKIVSDQASKNFKPVLES